METVIFKSYCFESESFKELTEILVIIENNLSSRHFQKLLVIFENYVFSKFTLTYTKNRTLKQKIMMFMVIIIHYPAKLRPKTKLKLSFRSELALFSINSKSMTHPYLI